jgi:hypothetical protein
VTSATQFACVVTLCPAPAATLGKDNNPTMPAITPATNQRRAAEKARLLDLCIRVAMD